MLVIFSSNKQDWAVDPCKNRARRPITHGIKMMRSGYRLLHYPIKTEATERAGLLNGQNGKYAACSKNGKVVL